jgi:aspartate/tyrosine/aromatic aminotransferase
MMFFDHIKKADPDPIIGINQAFVSDDRKDKVNLSIGVFKTAELSFFTLSSIRKARKILMEKGIKDEYLPIDGDQKFLELLKQHLFGPSLEQGRFYAAQSLGGTGAIRVLADCLKEWGYSRVLLSNPTWPNHKQIFDATGYSVEWYPYYSVNSKNVDFDKLYSYLESAPEKSVVVLHVCCHNPTGFDLTSDQWTNLADLLQKRELLPFFDCAYQGFAQDIHEDVLPIRYFAQKGIPFVAAYSCSKNFGLYGQRVGALFIYLEKEKQFSSIQSQVKQVIRKNYSTPPAYGAALVKEVLSNESLLAEWMHDVKNMRDRISEMRTSLVSSLMAQKSTRDFSFMKMQKGMFSFSGLNGDEVECLRRDYGIYLPKNGRINVAGLSPTNLDYVSNAISSVVSC